MARHNLLQIRPLCRCCLSLSVNVIGEVGCADQPGRFLRTPGLAGFRLHQIRLKGRKTLALSRYCSVAIFFFVPRISAIYTIYGQIAPNPSPIDGKPVDGQSHLGIALSVTNSAFSRFARSVSASTLSPACRRYPKKVDLIVCGNVAHHQIWFWRAGARQLKGDTNDLRRFQFQRYANVG
mgnify:CR=1 FL=1